MDQPQNFPEVGSPDTLYPRRQFSHASTPNRYLLALTAYRTFRTVCDTDSFEHNSETFVLSVSLPPESYRGYSMMRKRQ